MKKTIIYRYLGTNGFIDSPVHLEDTYYVRLVRLKADEGKVLTNGISVRHALQIPEEELSNWYEIDDVGQN